jgi:hypothetical protein
VSPFRKTEGEDGAVLQELGRLLLERLVLTHPDRAEAENGNLERVPVVQAVERQDLIELADAPGVPARIGGAVARRRADRREDLLALDEFEEVGVPDVLAVVVLELALAFGFKELDGLAHDLARAVVGVRAVELLWIEQNHSRLVSQLAAFSATYCAPGTPPTGR